MTATQIHHEAHDPVARPQLRQEPRPRRTRISVAGAAVLALAVAGVGLVVWLSGAVTDDAPGSTPSAEEDVAQDFLSAVTTFRADQVALHLSDDATMPQEWARDLKRDEALGVVYLVQPCGETSAWSTGANLVCPFDFHALGTDQLGRGPFADNAFSVRVDAGEVTSFQAVANTSLNGFDRYYDAVGSWVRANHPGDWGLMDSYESVSDADLPRWLRLWETRLAQYEDRFSTYLAATR